MELIDSMIQEGIPTGYIFCPEVDWTEAGDETKKLNTTEADNNLNDFKDLCKKEDLLIYRNTLQGICQAEYDRGRATGQQEGYDYCKSEGNLN